MPGKIRKIDFLKLEVRLAVVLSAFIFAVSGVTFAAESHKTLAKQILETTGVKGGLVVHLGCGDGNFTAAMRVNDSYLVHGLDSDATNVEKARQHIRSLGLYGKVSVEQWNANYLPYADNMVNLFISENLSSIPMSEVMRVLCPNGVAYIKRNGLDKSSPYKEKEDNWTKIVKPRPKEIDEWTHFMHGADNNAVARDTVIGPPGRVQWTAGPQWSKDHDVTPSVFDLVSANGRLFYILEEGPVCVIDELLPDKYSLVARDAFNGVILWKRKMSDWYSSRVIWGHIPTYSQRRVVAIGDRVYVTFGLQSPVSELDAATGATIQEYKNTNYANEIVYDQGILVLAMKEEQAIADGVFASRNHERFTRGYSGLEDSGKELMAVEAKTGKCLWRRDRHCVPSTLAVSGGRVFFAEDQEVVCLDLMSGKEVWTYSCPARTIVVQEGIVLAATGHHNMNQSIEITALSANDGKLLWTTGGRPLPNFYYFFFAPVDLFVARGMVWALTEDSEFINKPGSGYLLGLDLATGKIKARISLAGAFTAGHHVRCYKSKATENYLLFNKRGIEFIDIKSGTNHVQCQWVRGLCRYGILPCNGLIYAPPHACACYPGAKLNGFYALAPANPPLLKGEGEGVMQEDRLQRGTARAEIASQQSTVSNPDEWHTYRHDAKRSGSTPTVVLPNAQPLWQVNVGRNISAPVVTDGRVYFAAVDEHTVYCLDANSGKTLWTYTAGGRVDSPPTIYKGMVLFGCRDGWVYCVKSLDGELVWRFRAAPAERLVCAFEQLESTWPVNGSVLVREGVVYFAAGRSSFLDGGIYVYGIDATSGKVLFQTVLKELAPDVTATSTNEVRIPGAQPDILTSDGTNIYMLHVRLDNKLSVKVDAPTLSWGLKSDSHLLPGFGFLDGSLFNRATWNYSYRISGSQLLVVDGTDVYGMSMYWGASWNCPVFNPGEGYLLFRQNVSQPISRPATQSGQSGRIPQGRYIWNECVPVRVRAMVLTGISSDMKSESNAGISRRCLFVAGVPDEIVPDDPLATFEGRRGARLWALSAEDGEKLYEYKLDSAPVWDGMIAANGRLYISTESGNLLCMEGKEWKWKEKKIVGKKEPEKLVKPGGLTFSTSFDKGFDADESKGNGKADSKGVEIVKGAVLIGTGANLTYATRSNFNLSQGSIEFRISPQVDLVDNKNHKFFCIGKQETPNAFQLWKTGAFNDLHFRIYDSQKKSKEVLWKGIQDWKIGSWHHILASWNLGDGKLSLWVDGVKADAIDAGEPINISTVGERMWIGTEDGGGQEAMAMIDDLKIYDQEPPSGKTAESVKSAEEKPLPQKKEVAVKKEVLEAIFGEGFEEEKGEVEWKHVRGAFEISDEKVHSGKYALKTVLDDAGISAHYADITLEKGRYLLSGWVYIASGEKAAPSVSPALVNEKWEPFAEAKISESGKWVKFEIGLDLTEEQTVRVNLNPRLHKSGLEGAVVYWDDISLKRIK